MPILGRYQNNWATEVLIHRYVNGNKTYTACRDKTNTYIGKTRLARKKNTARLGRGGCDTAEAIRTHLGDDDDNAEEDHGRNVSMQAVE